MTILFFVSGVFDKKVNVDRLMIRIIAGVAMDAFILALLAFMK